MGVKTKEFLKSFGRITLVFLMFALGAHSCSEACHREKQIKKVIDEREK